MSPKVLALASQGPGSHDESRLRRLLDTLDCEFLALDRSHQRDSFFALLRRLKIRDGAIAVMEGTGVMGGFALILAALVWRRAYVVSSGDAVAPFLGSRWPWGYPVFWLYEKALYSCSRGFIGWTPYLAGRALTLGAPRAMTAAGFAPFARAAGSRVRERLGIPAQALVFGIAGALTWNPRRRYCYGLELVEAVQQLAAGTVCVLIVGDGTGWPELQRRAGPRLGVDIFLPGRVERQVLPEYLAAMDVGMLPQSVDGIGNFRYTTKVSEYIAARLPFISNQIPAAYDLFAEFSWVLPGTSPWDPRFLSELARLMATLTRDEVQRLRDRIPGDLREFDAARQSAAVRRFLEDIFRE